LLDPRLVIEFMTMTRVVLALRKFCQLALPYFHSEDRWRARLLLGGVIAAELGLVYVAVATINWNARFFNALEKRNWDMLIPEMVSFGFILCGAIVAGMASYYFVQTLTIRWREWTTARYIGLWMAEGRHYRMQFVDQSVDNIHLRIGNDVYVFIQRTLEIGVTMLNSVVALASFSYILWGISATTPLPLFSVDLSVPGYLIWIALAYAGIGTLIAHFIGRPLISFNFKQQRYEADFRFAMARVTDYSEPVALMKGEAVERQELRRRFGALVRNWIGLVRRHTRLTSFIAGYGHLSTAFPILIVTPAYMVGAIPLGILMQAGLAFQRVEGALAFCLSSYSKIAEWKAVVDRLSQFEAAILAVDRRKLPGSMLDFTDSADDGLAVQDLILRVANGMPIAAVSDLHVAPGERLLINGPSGSGKSCLLRALAGIWPLGEGGVHLPPDARVIALPQRRYFPLGTLRQVMTYPTPAQSVAEADIQAAMVSAGIGNLAAKLDDEAEWSAVLSGGEQQRVGFARALIHRPDMVLLDEAASALEEVEARQLYRMLSEHLPSAIIISIGRSAGLATLHQRVYEMRIPTATARIRPAEAVVAP
jgi:vitamin B12/bleomycin/antimicrobial peptide transport system ATP-binding/permease protein